MKRFKNNETIVVLGTPFMGVKDMIFHARERIPKCGVYVGEDSRLYPCFDSSDYAYENRRYTNLVFAKSQYGTNRGQLQQADRRTPPHGLLGR